MLIKEIILFIIILIFLFYFFKKKFLKLIVKYNLIDKPGKNKIHGKTVPLSGGILLIFSIFLYLILFNKFFGFENGLNEIVLIVIFASFFSFLIGFYDDILYLSSKKKILIVTIINILFFQNIELFKIKFLIFDNSFFELRINILSVSIFLSILSFLAYHYSLTIIDGINGLFGTYNAIFLSILLIFFELDSEFKNFIFFLILINLFIIYLNLKGDLFYGNSGSLTLSSILPYLTLCIYNSRENDIYIFSYISLIIIPILDIIRLFITRLINNKDPFSKDLNHLHHILLDKFSLKVTLIIYNSLCFLPFAINQYFKINEIITIALQMIIFIFIIKHKKINYCD